MLLKDKETGVLVKVLNPDALIDPTKSEIKGRIQAGEEEQDPAAFSKNALLFPSNEQLPRCWIDPHYQA